MDELKIDIDEFSGPLDLLLNLIEKSKINIEDIFLYDITEQYKKEIENLSLPISQLSKFIYILSILLLIKSDALIPKHEIILQENEIVEALNEYKKIKSVEKIFEDFEDIGLKQHTKIMEDLNNYLSKESNIPHDVEILAKEFNKVISRLDKEKENENSSVVEIKNKDINIDKLMKDFLDYISKKKEIYIEKITKKISSKNECIAVFLSLLELTRIGEIYLKQDEINNLFIIKR